MGGIPLSFWSLVEEVILSREPLPEVHNAAIRTVHPAETGVITGELDGFPTAEAFDDLRKFLLLRAMMFAGG